MSLLGGAGRLDKRVRLQKAVQTTSSSQVVDSYVDIGEFWAEVMPVKATERVEATKRQGFVTHTIRTRYNPDATAAARILLGTRVFHVEGVFDRFERHHEHVFSCVEEVS